VLPPRARRLFHLTARSDARARAARRLDDVDAEIELHLELRIEQLVARGVPPDEARRRALAKFGSVAEARARLDAAHRHREDRVHLRERLDALAHDVRLALRGLRRRPAFTLAVVLTLALGIGANATMFDIVDRLMLRPPAYLAAPERTGRVYLRTTSETGEDVARHFQYRTFRDLVDGTRAFSHAAAVSTNPYVVGEGDEARQERVTLASGGFWSLFEARPVVGRFFGPADDALPAGRPVLVLSHAYWRARYGGDPGVVGRAVRVGRTVFTVVGVAPEGFTGAELEPVVAWIPMSAGAHEQFGTRPVGRSGEAWHQSYFISWVEMLARRRPGVTVDDANAALTATYRRSYGIHRAQSANRLRAPDEARPRAEIASILHDRGPAARPEARVAVWLGGVALLVLLIACANVASLMLARSVERRREVAVRIALGVSRARLVGQALLEGATLAILGGALGLVAAAVGGGVLRRALLPELGGGAGFGGIVDGRVLAFTLVASLAAGLLSSLAPAVQAMRGDAAVDLRAGARGGGRRRAPLRAGLLVAQGTLTVLLLVGAGLFVRSLRNVRALDLGYDAARLLYLAPDLRGTALGESELVTLRDRLRERALALPQVEAAAVTLTVPYRFVVGEIVRVPGVDSTRLPEFVAYNAVSPDYFRTAGTRLVRGRGFTASDRAGAAPVVVISEAAARAIWPRQDALGRCLKVGADTAPCATVVGIAGDVRASLPGGPAEHVYVPAAQGAHERAGLYVRTRGEARPHAESIRRELQRLMPGHAFIRALPVQDLVDPSVRSWRLGATMFTLFGLLALLVAAVGLYSVIAYGVAQRRQELGVRIALGARTTDVLRLVVTEGLRVAVLALVLGGGLALVAGRWVKPLLYDVSERDPATFAAVAGALLVVAVVASLIPARRAARVDPSISFRAD
jgi:predicted permease